MAFSADQDGQSLRQLCIEVVRRRLTARSADDADDYRALLVMGAAKVRSKSAES